MPAGTGGTQVEATWSNDGTQIVYSQNGQLVLDNPNDKSVKPVPDDRTPARDHQPQPVVRADEQRAHHRLHPAERQRDAQLCFATIGTFALQPICTSAPGWELGGQVDLVAGRPDDPRARRPRTAAHTFGLLAFNSNVAVLDPGVRLGPRHARRPTTSVAGQGVFAGAFSPNGKKMALVSNIGTGDFNLYIVPAGNFKPNASQQLPVSACQVAWRSDGQAARRDAAERAVRVRPRSGRSSAINLANPRSPTILDEPRARTPPGSRSRPVADPRSPMSPPGSEPLVLVLPDGARFPLRGRDDDRPRR